MKWATFCIVLLSVPCRTCLPIFIEIGLYLTDTAEDMLAQFFEARCSFQKMIGLRLLRKHFHCKKKSSGGFAETSPLSKLLKLHAVLKYYGNTS